MKYVERSSGRVTWLHPELTHGEFVEKICPKNKKDKGELQLRVRYFPQEDFQIAADWISSSTNQIVALILKTNLRPCMKLIANTELYLLYSTSKYFTIT